MNDNDYSVGAAYRLMAVGLGRRGIAAMAAAAFLVLLASMLANQPAVLIGMVVDRLLATDGQDAVWPLFALMMATILGKEFLVVGQKLLIEKAATRLQFEEFVRVVAKLLRLPVDTLQDRRIGEVANRIDRSISGLIRLQKLTFLEFVPSLLLAFVALWLACRQHWIPGVSMFVAVFLGGLITAVQIASQNGIRIDLDNKRANMGGTVSELLGHLPYVRVAGMAERETKHLGSLAGEIRDVEMSHHKWMMSFDAAKQLVDGVGLAAVIGFGVHLAMAGEITAGTILTLALLYGKASQPLQILHRVIDEGHEAVIAVGGLSDIRSLPQDPGLAGAEPPCPARDGAMVVLEGAGVGYRHREDGPPALKRVTLAFAARQAVGLAGPTGSGKSTLLKLILGLIHQFGGKVEVMGAEVITLDKTAFAAEIAYAPQDPFIISGTLRENLTVNGKACDDDALARALALACIPLDEWPNGLDSPIHEGGRNLSGGQKQRIALARIFLSTASLVVLDEATSALDNLTEAKVMAALKEHCQGRTVITVAHRLSTLRSADRILVLDAGNIVQDGGYEELASTPGMFQRLLRQAGQ